MTTTQQPQGNSLLKELYDIEDNDPTGAYSEAERELKKLKTLSPYKNTFYVCEGKDSGVRQYVAKRFMNNGLEAEALTTTRTFYDGETIITDCVKVVIPGRENK